MFLRFYILIPKRCVLRGLEVYGRNLLDPVQQCLITERDAATVSSGVAALSYQVSRGGP